MLKDIATDKTNSLNRTGQGNFDRVGLSRSQGGVEWSRNNRVSRQTVFSLLLLYPARLKVL